MNKILTPLLLLLVAAPSWAQLTDAHSLWKKQISSTAPTNGQCLVWVSATSKWTPSSCGAGGSPGGSNTQLQYNNSGSFGGAAGWLITNSGLTLTGSATSILDLSTSGAKFKATSTFCGTGITCTTTSNSTVLSFNSAVLAGAFFDLTGSNAVLAGSGNTFTPSATTEAIRLVGTNKPSAPTAGAINISATNSFGWYGTKWIEFTNTVTGNRTITIQDASGTMPLLIASGTKALATSVITAGTCTSAQTLSATGTLTTDNISADFNADPTGVTGYAPSTDGMLAIIKYPTADTVNIKVCNNTGADITPGAITLNVRVLR